MSHVLLCCCAAVLLCCCQRSALGRLLQLTDLAVDTRIFAEMPPARSELVCRGVSGSFYRITARHAHTRPHSCLGGGPEPPAIRIVEY